MFRPSENAICCKCCSWADSLAATVFLAAVRLALLSCDRAYCAMRLCPSSFQLGNMRAGRFCRPLNMSTPMPVSPSLPKTLADSVKSPRMQTRCKIFSGTVATLLSFSWHTKALLSARRESFCGLGRGWSWLCTPLFFALFQIQKPSLPFVAAT